MYQRLTGVLKHYWQPIVFFLLVFLALILRTYRLETLPAGLTIDEASIGYNAYGLVTNHRDEWLVRTPLSFKAFGEFKPPVAIYATALTTALFGVNHFSIRLPMALAGVVTTLATFWIARKISGSINASLAAMALVAISPINIHFSRIAFESSIGVAAVATGAALYLWAGTTKRLAVLYLASFATFGLAMYSNHATKIIVPFTIGFLVLQSIKVWTKRPAGIIVGGLLFLLICLPLLNQTINGAGAERFFMVSAITTERGLKPFPEIFSILIQNCLAHFNPSVLLFGQTDSYRHGNGVYGVLSFLELICLLIGMWFVFRNREFSQRWWIFALVLIAFLPAAIGTTIPHPNRIHHLVPWVHILAGIGLWRGLSLLSPAWKIKVTVILVILFGIQLFWQATVYNRVFGTLAAQDFQYGYRAAVEYANQHEESVDEIFFTSKYDHPYIYLLLYKEMPPMTYHFGGLIKYRLMNIKWQELKSKKSTLIIAAPDEIPDSVPATALIYFPDGSIAFKIIKL